MFVKGGCVAFATRRLQRENIRRLQPAAGDDGFNGLICLEIYTKTYEHALVLRIEWQKSVVFLSKK